MKLAFMFPGQGSQYVGMGKDLYTGSSEVKNLFEKTEQILGYRLSEIMFSGYPMELSQTENTQPAILLVSFALWHYLCKHKKISDYSVIGHSLGEYSAYVASGRLSFEDAIRLVRKRGLLMAQQFPSTPGEYGMAAALKISMEDLQDVLNSYGSGEVFIANDNCPGQVVISGAKYMIENLASMIETKGGRLVSLDVSGAFHSPYMKKVAEYFEEELSKVSFQNSSIPLYTNLTALPLKEGEEKSSLMQQIYKPVRFRESIQNMIQNEGITHFIEVGPGRVLQGLVRKIDPSVKVLGIEKMEDVERILQGEL